MATNDPSVVAIRPDLLIPELLDVHPEARAVLDRYGLRGCGGPLGPYESIGFFARAHGVEEAGLLDELDRAIATPRPRPGVAAAASPQLADTIYRRYFLGAILVALTAGASWGAWLLWTIALGGSFRGVSINSVNAHGEAQVFGWVGLFIMGFAYQAFPRLWHTTLAAPRLSAAAFQLMVTGLMARTIGIAAADSWRAAPAIALAGGGLELAAVLIFGGQILVTFLRSGSRLEPYIGFVIAALGWFAASGVLSVWHTWNTTTVRSADAMIWYVATYQSPLRDLQVHGLALFMILGVSLRMLPALYGLPRVADRRAWLALALLVGGVLGEVGLFLAARWTGRRLLMACLPLPWSMLAVGCAMVVLPWRPWRPFPEPDRCAKFVRAAFAWLAVSMTLLLVSPAYQYAYRNLGGPRELPFSHAFPGAIRHAITVGFISMMILGFAARVVPTLNGVDPRRLSALRGPFLLVNAGCLLRVALQIQTDWSAGIYPLLGISGTLEVAGLAWWGIGLVRIIARGRRETGALPQPRGPRPERIEGHHRVADVLDWFPETEPVFLNHGFTAIRQPLPRRTVARQITLAQAASLRGVPLDGWLDALNRAIAARHRSTDPRRFVLPIVETGAQR